MIKMSSSHFGIVIILSSCVGILVNSSQPATPSYRVSIEPQIARRGFAETTTVTCSAVDATGNPVPLVGCQFKERDSKRFVDLSHGRASPLDTYSYHGAGLHKGECGVTLGQGYPPGFVVLGCRVRAAGGPWQHQHMLIHATDGWRVSPYKLYPKETLVFPGGDVTLHGVSNKPLVACEFYLPGHSALVDLSLGAASASTDEYRYNGTELQSGQCGVTLTRVTERLSGVVVVDVRSREGEAESRTDFATIIVATPPDPPILSIHVTDLVEGESLHATCVVASSRPMANLTWYLGDDVIRQDGVNEAPAESEWRWRYDKQTIMQHLTLPLTLEDDGRELWCQAGHIALPTGKATSKTYRIHLKKQAQCGIRNSSPATIAGGHDAEAGEFPWHAGLYRRLNEATFEQICGATLVKPNIVVTAAHCVYDERHSRVHNHKSYKVVLGKLFRDWSVDLGDKEVQRMDVASIAVPPNYRGRRLDYRYDMAVLRLTAEAVVTLRVNVACVDWDNQRNNMLSPGNQGVVAGWGVTRKDNEVAATLQWVDLPWVDADKCHDDTPLETRKYITHDKFCAGFLNMSTSVCKGDSGGGILFKQDKTDRYFLRGVVSTNLVRDVDRNRCNSDLYTTFTSVADYIRWLTQNV